jgi:hypothetical protein
MQHTATLPPRGASELEYNPPFNIVIAYEDFETGKQAKRTYDFLVDNLGHDCQFTSQMWKFDILSIPKLRQIALKDAAAADIVIISCHGDELPEHVKAWIEAWLADGIRPLALVALVDRPAEDFAPHIAREYLADVARRGGMEFFAQRDPRPNLVRIEEPSGFRIVGNQKGKTLSSLAGMLEQDSDSPRWGINE